PLGPLVVPSERRGQCLVRTQPEPTVVALLAGPAARQHPVDPALFTLRDVLDQATHAERARGGGGPSLLVGQPIGGDAEQLALLGEVCEQSVTFVDDRWNLSWHCVHP